MNFAEYCDLTPSISKFEMAKNTAFGGAGVCVAIIFVLTQMTSPSIYSQAGIFAAAVGLPFWVLCAAANEYFVYGGLQFFHLAPEMKQVLKWPLIIANVCIPVALACCIAIVWPFAALAFGVAAFMSIILGVRMDRLFQRHAKKLVELRDGDNPQ